MNNQLNSQFPPQEIAYDKETNKKANILSLISIFLLYLNIGVALVFEYLKIEMNDLIENVTGIFPLIGLIMMVYVRVKYPKNVLGKVSMWLYIATFVISIVLLVVAIVACGITFVACVEGCGRIG